VDTWNGVEILEPSCPTVHIYTDASESKGLGGVFGEIWFFTRCPCQFWLWDIQFKETYMVLQAILRWGHNWTGHHIIFHVDNAVVVLLLLSGTIKNAQVMDVLRTIVMLAVQLGFSYSSVWLASIENQLADTISHFEYTHLFNMAPSIQCKSCQTHPQLCGIKLMLTCTPMWHSSYGMECPP